MISKRDITSIYPFNILDEHAIFFKDGAKRVLVIAQVCCSFLWAWPENVGLRKTIFYSILAINCLILGISLLVFLFIGVRNVSDLTDNILLIDCILQSGFKKSLLFYKSERIKVLVKVVREEFWPSNLFGVKIGKSTRGHSKLLFVILLIECITSESFLIMFVILPLTKSTRELPHKSWFPFDWSATPMYQIIYLMHSLFIFYDINIIGYDLFYCGMCFNCTTQFRLLCSAIRYIGSGKEEEIVTKLVEISEDDFEKIKKKQKDPTEILLVLCIRHHQRILRVSQDLNDIFGNGHLVQFTASILGICAACYGFALYTTAVAHIRTIILFNEPSQFQQTDSPNIATILVNIVTYLAHTAQLFIYCAVSNEFSHWSTNLAMAAYDSLWYTRKYTNLRRNLCIVTMRSQEAIIMSAFGLFHLNLSSFLSIMRFTFSLYIFLSTLTK